VRRIIAREIATRPYTRFMVADPFGNSMVPPASFSIAPYWAVDVQSWIRAAIVDGVADGQKQRSPNVDVGLHLGLTVSDDTHYYGTRQLAALTDLDWVLKSIKAWRWAGFTGKIGFDASAAPQFAAAALALEKSIPGPGMLREGLPLKAGVIDASLLVKSGAWCRREFNPGLSSWIAPLAPAGECVVIWNQSGPDALTVTDMTDFRKRGFVLGCDSRYDGALAEAMK
jgi:hypothetical protein